MEKNYIIFAYSRIRMVLVMFLPILFLIILIIPLAESLFGKVGEYFGLGLAIVIALVNFFKTPRYLAKSILGIRTNSKGFSVYCIKPFFGKKPGEEILINYSDLKFYKFERSYNIEIFKLTFKDDRKFRIIKWNDDDDDQFLSFRFYFERQIKAYNNRKRTIEKIEREKTLFENKVFLIIVASVIILIFIATILLFTFKGIENKGGVILLFIFLSPLIWVSYEVFTRLKSMK